jgi:hypothetical protein
MMVLHGIRGARGVPYRQFGDVGGSDLHRKFEPATGVTEAALYLGRTELSTSADVRYVLSLFLENVCGT